MTRDLKHSVNEHLESVRLDASHLRRLERMQRQSAGRPWWRHRALAVGLVACIIAAVTVMLLPLRGTLNAPSPAIAVAEEVVMHHLRRRPLEVRGDSLAAIEGYFDELGFRLVDSLRPAIGGGLLGGRYCSVQGVTAAQLRREDPSGRTQTLYQLPYDRSRFGTLPDIARGEPPHTLKVRGLLVDLWVERGLLFALAREQ